MSSRILFVEDDDNLRFVVEDNLRMEGFEVQGCADGIQGKQAFEPGKFDLCILDVMMPGLDGISLAKEIRTKDEGIPILFLTAKGQKEDRINGFRAGGDDYITKPFSIEELVCRIRVFLRRTGQWATGGSSDTFVLGSSAFCYPLLELRNEQDCKQLTQREADLLRVLCENKGQVVKRDDLMKAVWGDDDYFIGRSMDVFISKLRKYLKHEPTVEITNVYGVGFRLVEKG
ncbi:MAG: response regulator transcription factor [Cyclobacteriaceae bacterium]